MAISLAINVVLKVFRSRCVVKFATIGPLVESREMHKMNVNMFRNTTVLILLL